MNASLRISLPLLLGAFSLSACAQPPAPSPAGQAAAPAAAAPGAAGRVTAALKKIDPDVKPERVQPAPVAGFQQVIVGGQVLYVSNDGKYLMQGTLYDIDNRRDAGAAALAGMRKDLVAQIPLKDRIVFAPANPKHTVTVFTDVECGYCRKLHQEIDEYNRLGIAVEYLAFPRMGPASEDFTKMVSVWCASDRRQALSAAKADLPVPKRDCTSPVARHYDIGQRVGLTGTPMIVTADGTQMPGYMPPADLRAALDRLAAEAGTVPAAAPSPSPARAPGSGGSS